MGVSGKFLKKNGEETIDKEARVPELLVGGMLIPLIVGSQFPVN